MECITTLEGHADRVWHLSWSSDGESMVSCSADKSLRVWSADHTKSSAAAGLFASGMKCTATLSDAHEKTIRRCSWHPKLPCFAASSFDGTVSVWAAAPYDSIGWVCSAALEGHENEVKGVAWDSTGAHLASSGRDKSVWVWDSDESAHEFECSGVCRGHAQDVKSVAWAAHEPVLFSASYDNTVREWRYANGDWECSATLEAHSSTVWCVAADPTVPNRIASCSDDATVIIWEKKKADRSDEEKKEGEGDAEEKDKEEWTAAHSIRGCFDGRPVYGIAWHPTRSGVIAVAGGDDSVRVFVADASKGGEFVQVTAAEHAHTADVNCVAWNPAHTDTLASCGDDNAIKLWHVSFDAPAKQ